MTKTYMDIEINKTLKSIRILTHKKKIDFTKIKIQLYKLWNVSFKEGVYVGK